MRQQLFDYVIPVAPPPRLHPNLFARVARTSYTRATAVMLIWLVVCAALLSAALFNPQKSAHARLTFSSADSAARNLAILDYQFPNLNALMTISISNPDPEQLKLARLNLITELEQNGDSFELVLAPGAGDYYQSHAILYYPLDVVKARVEYALSLKPLFSAVAASPTTESLATLVNEVSASITLGRDPQGLDAMFDESARAVKSLMEGNDRHVDWSQIAGLNFEPQSKDAVVLALPKLGMNNQAQAVVQSVITKLASSGETEMVLRQAKAETLSQPPVQNSTQAFPFIALALIFVAFVLFVILGRLNLAVMIVLPVLISELVSFSAFTFVFAEQVPKLWPVFLGVAICSLQISSRLAFAILETFSVAASTQSAVMLAFQKQGSGILWLTCLAVLVWCGWFSIAEAPYAIVALIAAISILVGVGAVFTLLPALAHMLPGAMNWRAAEWFVPVYHSLFANNTWRTLRKFIAVVSVLAACTSLFYSSRLLSPDQVPVNRNQTVNVLVSSKPAVTAALQTMDSIPEAKSVRWLGAFLPDQMDDKLGALQSLQNQFPRFKPMSPQEPAALRDQITSLLVSLEEIATSAAARSELRSSAHNFRRSLEILSNTTSNGEVLEFENRIFGAFNLLAEHADALGTLDKPSLETLDPKLKALFVSSQNVFRLEVTPAEGVSPAALAHKLADAGLAVAHPALQADNSRKVLLATSGLVLVAMLLLGLLALVFAIGEVSGSIASLATSFIAICTVFGMGVLANTKLSQPALLQATALFAAILVIVGTSFLKRQITEHAPPDASHAAEAWLPTIVVAAVAAPAVLLNFTPWSHDLGIFAVSLSVITCTVALLLRPLTLALRRYGV